MAFLNDSAYKNYYGVIKKATGKSELEIIVTKLYWLQEYMYRYNEIFHKDSGLCEAYTDILEQECEYMEEDTWEFVCDVLDNGRAPD